MTNCLVYSATNRLNGDMYIGATRKTLERRRYRHLSDARYGKGKCRIFYAAIRKYGEDAFIWKIVREFSSIEKCMQEEMRLIATLKPKFGVVGIVRTKEWYEKVSKALKGRKPSALSIQRTRERIKAMARKTCVCLNDGCFGNLNEFSKKYGITEKRIGGVCRNEEKAGRSAAGRFFIWADAPLSDDERIERLNAAIAARNAGVRTGRKNSSKALSKPVVCLATGEVFPNGRSAAAHYGLSPIRISQLCNSGGATKNGVSFEFARP